MEYRHILIQDSPLLIFLQISGHVMGQAVGSLSTHRTGFNLIPVRVGFVVDEVAMAQIFLQELQSCLSVSFH